MQKNILRKTACTSPERDAHQFTERDGSPTWLTRADGFIVAITHARRGTSLVRDKNQEESMIILPHGQSAQIQAGHDSIDAQGNSLTILPPGQSIITVHQAGWVCRLFGAAETDLAKISANAEEYMDRTTQALSTPPSAWPPPEDGWRIRHYKLDDYTPKDNNDLILPRIFRSSNLMINAFVPFRGLRPENAVRPHMHEGFDQASITISGKWMHYARTPWGPDMTQWRPDESFEVPSPSTTIFPAQVIHTSRNLTKDAWMLDVFGPPRLDLANAGLVLNGDEYPLPKLDHAISEREIAISDREIPTAWTKLA